ncbi:MAG: UPF0236 family protein [Desulfobacterales bacterium]|nr:UPF0236 family protein [Desulfobacterales bacterium]
MNTIIHQFTEKVMADLEKELIKVLQENDGNISEIVLTLKKRLDKLGRDLCSYAIEELDDILRNDQIRKEDWYIERRDDAKTLLTIFGEVKYKRTYYKSKKGKGYKYLVDERLGINPHQKMDSSLKAAVIDLAIENSYKISGRRLLEDIEISDQTVMNNIRRLEVIDNSYMNKPQCKKQVKVLYVEADEDHVALQRS